MIVFRFAFADLFMAIFIELFMDPNVCLKPELKNLRGHVFAVLFISLFLL